MRPIHARHAVIIDVPWMCHGDSLVVCFIRFIVLVPNLQAEVENDDDDIVEEADEKDGGKTATSVCDTSSQMFAQTVFSVMIRGDASREKGPKGRGRGPVGLVKGPNLDDWFEFHEMQKGLKLKGTKCRNEGFSSTDKPR